jgi:simple sugar transport system ATP-binding protein
LIGLSDSIKVMFRGRFVADADPATVTPEDLGSAMTGAGDVDAEGHLVTEAETSEQAAGTATEGDKQ